MSETIRITVPFDIERLSPNRTRRMHRMAIERLAKRAKTAALLAWRAAGSPELSGKVRIDLTIRRMKALDPDNALGACKDLVDSLFRRNRLGYGITPDDARRYVEYGEVRQETGREWKGREEVEVVVSPREERN